MDEKQKILIVDDQPANLYAMDQILKETGAEIICVQSGNEALAASLNHDFAIALLDIQMPDMDGYELAEFMRDDVKNSELPIIFISAVYSSDYHVFRGYDAGAVDFLAKPFDAKVLLSKVKVFLQLDRQKRLLHESGKRLAEVNQNLEQMVRSRTADLHEAVEVLKAEIAGRFEAEKELIKAKKDWQEIFEAIGHMTMILDKDQNILVANRATLLQTGLSREAIIGQKCCHVFHNLNQATCHCPFKAMKDTGQFEVTEAEIDAFGRSYIVSCTPILDDDGQLEKVIHISTDITARKQLKKELIQAHKMEAIGSLAGGIAHDFNNILSAVLGYTELSLNKAQSDPGLTEDLQQIHTAGMRAKDLVGQILNFARKTDDDPKPVRIDIIVKEVVKFLRSTIPCSVQIKEDIASKSLVLSNPVKIHQLVMNLCTNAAHAMHETGLLEVSLHELQLKAADFPKNVDMRQGLYQRLEIADNGCGIPAEIIESIFQPFFTTKDIHEGTGMGLAMVDSIVKECGGHISVASVVGKGTVFTILLPVTTKDDNQPVIENKKDLPGGTERILLVDDETAICKLASRMLEQHGYTVTTETNPVSALKLFTASPDSFDLVITDMTMPELTGDKLAEKILVIRPGIPVIIVTGYSKQMSENHAENLGAKTLMAKPFEKADLIETVRKALDKGGAGKLLGRQ